MNKQRHQMKYFNGQQEIFHPYNMPNKEFAIRFPGVKGMKADSFSRWVAYSADKQMFPVERKIEFKSNPSMHVCDARCMNAKGRSCECSCGGKNHGANGFICN